MIILGVAPKFDEATEYSFKWFEKIMDVCDAKISGRPVSRIEVEHCINQGYDTLIFYDHGSCDCLWGNPSEKIVDKYNVDDIAKFVKRIYTMACLSSKVLGVRFFERDVLYVGYIREFAFTPYDEHYFEYVVTEGVKALIQGLSAPEVKRIMIDAFNKAMREAKDPWTKIWLQWDRDSLRVYDKLGDKPSWWQRIWVKLF